MIVPEGSLPNVFQLELIVFCPSSRWLAGADKWRQPIELWCSIVSTELRLRVPTLGRTTTFTSIRVETIKFTTLLVYRILRLAANIMANHSPRNSSQSNQTSLACIREQPSRLLLRLRLNQLRSACCVSSGNNIRGCCRRKGGC